MWVTCSYLCGWPQARELVSPGMPGSISEGSLEEVETAVGLKCMKALGHVTRVSVRKLEGDRVGEVKLRSIDQHRVRIAAQKRFAG